jgi:hypothetical protein
MSQHRGETITERVRVTHSGRDGITLSLLRQFVREADELHMPGDVAVRWKDELAGEGANRSGYVEAVHSASRELPIVLPGAAS